MMHWIIIMLFTITNNSHIIQRDTNFKSIHQLQYEQHQKDTIIDTALNNQEPSHENKKPPNNKPTNVNKTLFHFIISLIVFIIVIFTFIFFQNIYMRKKRTGG